MSPQRQSWKKYSLGFVIGGQIIKTDFVAVHVDYFIIAFTLSGTGSCTFFHYDFELGPFFSSKNNLKEIRRIVFTGSRNFNYKEEENGT